jgi:type III pantothenate kinase
MILAVDVGNTRTKAMLVGPRRVIPMLALGTAEVLKDPGAVRRRLQKHRNRYVGLDGAALCSVVPSLDRTITAAVESVTGRRVLAVRHTCRFPFRLGVADPRKVGADRLSAAAGAVGRRRRSAIVVDVGSAVTVDLVLDRTFRGGLIMPGPGLGLWALGKYARRLPAIDVHRLKAFPGDRFDDTRPSMMVGARVAAHGAVVEAVRALRRACGAAPPVVLTGGGLAILDPGLPRSWLRDPHLVGRGLYTLTQKKA